MTDVAQRIRIALASSDDIPRQHVREWIEQSDSVAVDALLYELTRDAWKPIQPPLEQGEACALIQPYLLRCMREDPTGGLAMRRYEAAAALEAWFDHLAARADTYPIAHQGAAARTDLFGDGDAQIGRAS